MDGATVGGEKEEVRSTGEEFKVLLFRGRGGTESRGHGQTHDGSLEAWT